MSVPVTIRGKSAGTTDDFRRAPSGDLPLGPAWINKPHRLVYDLCSALEEQADELARLRAIEAMARQAYEADAVAGWFDSEGDGLRAALDAIPT